MKLEQDYAERRKNEGSTHCERIIRGRQKKENGNEFVVEMRTRRAFGHLYMAQILWGKFLSSKPRHLDFFYHTE